ncbi:VTT domain-containing protein [Neobacillus sp. FSL H8-0543]|uniref:TVP38/TMEM64 family protein n=1 Tax=Neobacillus sp. FSL H8-0543 TaxID=2954672 RepID=UPI0031593ABB
MSNKAKKAYSRILLAALVLLLGISFYMLNRDLFTTLMDGDIESIKLLLGENSAYSYLFTFIIMLVQNSFTIIPLILVITINIALFGFVKGFIWSWVTSIAGSIFLFMIVRYVFQDGLIKKVSPILIEKLEQEGFLYVFQARIFPLFPTSLVNLVAGLSTIRFYPFLFGTLFGNFIYFFFLSLIPAGFISKEVNEYVLGGLVLLLFVIYYSYKKFYKRKWTVTHQREGETSRFEE